MKKFYNISLTDSKFLQGKWSNNLESLSFRVDSENYCDDDQNQNQDNFYFLRFSDYYDFLQEKSDSSCRNFIPKTRKTLSEQELNSLINNPYLSDIEFIIGKEYKLKVDYFTHPNDGKFYSVVKQIECI